MHVNPDGSHPANVHRQPHDASTSEVETISAAELKAHGVDPDEHYLIKLPDPSNPGEYLCPAFQVNQSLWVVEFGIHTVNLLIGVVEDPQAALDWWLSTELLDDGRTPVSLLGDMRHFDLLRSIAQSTAEQRRQY